MDDTLTFYLRDLVELLRDKGRETRREIKHGGASEFQSGRMMALCEVMTLMQAQADAFGIPRESIGLDKVDAERELLVPRRPAT